MTTTWSANIDHALEHLLFALAAHGVDSPLQGGAFSAEEVPHLAYES